MRQYLTLGPIRVRLHGRMLAPWGYPRLEIGGLSFWSWTNGGDFSPIAYHPRWSLTWLWFVHITRRPGRGYCSTFGKDERARMAALYAAGNPYAPRPRWWHRFVQPAAMRRGQWTDYVRLPFGFTMMIGHQEPMRRRD